MSGVVDYKVLSVWKDPNLLAEATAKQGSHTFLCTIFLLVKMLRVLLVKNQINHTFIHLVDAIVKLG